MKDAEELAAGNEDPAGSKLETFATAVCCIDGRAQEPVMAFARSRFGAGFVDMVNKPGAVATADDAIRSAVAISMKAHRSLGIVVSAHSDCAANPVPDETQKEQCRALARELAAEWREVEVVPVWVPIPGELEVL